MREEVAQYEQTLRRLFDELRRRDRDLERKCNDKHEGEAKAYHLAQSHQMRELMIYRHESEKRFKADLQLRKSEGRYTDQWEAEERQRIQKEEKELIEKHAERDKIALEWFRNFAEEEERLEMEETKKQEKIRREHFERQERLKAEHELERLYVMAILVETRRRSDKETQ